MKELNKKEIEEKKLKCQTDLRYLCKDVLGFDKWSKFHDDLQTFIETSQKKRKLILVPRGHFKTSIVTIGYSIQRILRDNDIRILICSYTWQLTRDILSELSAYLTGASELDKLFGEFKPNLKNYSGWNMNGITIKQRKKPRKEMTITTAGVDKNLVGQHYDLIILDDIVAEDNIGTREQREKIKRFYRNCLSLLEPDGDVIVIGTTWHEDDIYNDIRNKHGDWYDSFDIYVRKAKENGKLVFPERFNEEVIKTLKKELGPVKFSAQYMLNPYPSEEMVFRKEWFQYYDDLPPDKYYISGTLDPSLGKADSDPAAISVTAINTKGKIFVLEARRFKCHPDLLPGEVIKSIRMVEKLGYTMNVFGIEAYNFQQLLTDPIRRAFLANNIGVYLDELPKMSSISKNQRIMTLIPKYASGMILHKSHTLYDYETEALRWKREVERGQRDDILDAMAWQAIMYWERKPKPGEMSKVRPYSFQWWLNQNAPKKNDIFSDMRLQKSNPGVLN